MGWKWRRDPESNWARRICNPLHNRFAIAPNFPYKKGKHQLPLFVAIWSGKRDSNSRPQPWQGCALPTELFPRFKRRIIATFLPSSDDSKELLQAPIQCLTDTVDSRLVPAVCAAAANGTGSSSGKGVGIL